MESVDGSEFDFLEDICGFGGCRNISDPESTVKMVREVWMDCEE